MSGFRAPTELTPATGDQPISTPDGRPTFYMLSWMQRIQSFLGQPGGGGTSGGGSGGGATISEQLSTLNSEVAGALSLAFASPGQQGRKSSVTAEEVLAIGTVAPPLAVSPATIAAFRAQIWFGNG